MSPPEEKSSADAALSLEAQSILVSTAMRAFASDLRSISKPPPRPSAVHLQANPVLRVGSRAPLSLVKSTPSQEGLLTWDTTRRPSLVSNGMVFLLQMSCMLLPVAGSAACTLVLVHVLGLKPDGSPPFDRLLPGAAYDGIVASMVNASAVVAAVILVTFLFALAFRHRYQAGLYALLGWCNASAVALLVGWVLYSVARTSPWRLDYLLLAFLSCNVGAGAATGILVFQDLCPPLAHASLLLVSVSVAWIFLCFDGGTLVAVLVGLVIWDVYAVLGPGGPIKFVIARALHYKHMAIDFPMPPGISYVAKYYSLGTGDLIFYCVLVGRAYFQGIRAALLALMGVEMGVIGTVYATTVGPYRTLPALPLSILLGGAFWVFGYFVVDRSTGAGGPYDDGGMRGVYF